MGSAYRARIPSLRHCDRLSKRPASMISVAYYVKCYSVIHNRRYRMKSRSVSHMKTVPKRAISSKYTTLTHTGSSYRLKIIAFQSELELVTHAHVGFDQARQFILSYLQDTFRNIRPMTRLRRSERTQCNGAVYAYSYISSCSGPYSAVQQQLVVSYGDCKFQSTLLCCVKANIASTLV